MRILQIHNLYREPGGEDVVVANEADLLRGAGHDVFQHQAENPTAALATARRLMTSSWNRSSARVLGEAITEFRPDVAHVHNTWYSLSGSVIGELRRRGVPVVMTLHNYRLACANAQFFRDGGPCTLCVGSHPWHGVRHACYRGSRLASLAAARAITKNRMRGLWTDDVDVFLVLSRFARGLFAKAGVPERKMRIQPNFVPDPGPRPAPPSASTTVLIVSRMSAEKGVDTVLDAWTANRPRSLELHVVGDGPQRPELEARHVPGVTFRGLLPQSEVRALMLEARALLFPSRMYEGQPMAMTEAFAAGLPVVASGHGAMAEMIGAENDWLAAPGDRAAWSGAIAGLEQRDVDRMGETVRNRYEVRYTAAARLRGLLEAYEEAGSG